MTNTANRQIARAAGTVMFAFVLSNIVGLVRQVLVSNAFGTNQSLDAFYAAATFPDLLFSLLAGGALASAFVPTFSGILAKENRDEAWRLASSVINLVILILSLVSGLAALFAPALVRHVIFFFTIFGVSGLLMSILNTHQKFWLPALAPVFNWVGWIFGIIFLVPTMGIYGLAWGYVIGATLHLIVQLPGLLKLDGYHYIPTLGLNNSAVSEVARLMAPRLLGVAAVQVNFVINTMIATAQSTGSLAAIKVAFMVMTMPLFIIAQSIATAALPTFSTQVALGKLSEMRSSLAATLRGVILLSLPATVGLILLREPVIAALFQRGEFDELSTQMVSWALLWYTAGLVGHSIVEILSRAFYALHDTKTPVIVGTIAMGLNVIFSFGFAWIFSQLGWMPHGGLALANSVATALEATVLFILMHKRLDGIEGKSIWDGAWRVGLASFGMAISLLFWIQLSGGMNRWIVTLGGVAIGGVIYLLGVVILKVPEIKMVISAVRRRILKSDSHL